MHIIHIWAAAFLVLLAFRAWREMRKLGCVDDGPSVDRWQEASEWLLGILILAPAIWAIVSVVAAISLSQIGVSP
jgi:hypothetical protein